MKDSRMTAQWIAEQVARNPIVRLSDGTIRTCPVRLLFVNVVKAAERKGDDGDTRMVFDATIGFPAEATPQVNAVIWPAWYELCREKFPRQFDGQGNPQGLHWPLHDGVTKPQYSGYTPGALFMSCSSQFKPTVVDPALNPVVDPERVYAGVWAICGLNVYSYKNKKTGVGFGLQTIMLIGDDTKLGGQAPDPKTVYAGINIDASFNPAAAFGGRPAGPPGMPPPSSILPPPTPVYAPAYAVVPDYDPIG